MSAAESGAEPWELGKGDIKFQKREDEDGDLEKVKLGKGGFATVYLGKSLYIYRIFRYGTHC